MTTSISGSTLAYLIPGDPVRNVRLPRMFNAAFERFGIDAVLVPVQVPLRDFAVFFKSAFLARNVRGMVIAPPHKPLAVDLLDGCGLFGRVAGSVNVVRRIENNELEGDLFDGEGLLGALDHFNIPFRGKRVLILGAGVSAAAIGVALAEGGTVDGAEHIAFYDTSAGRAAGVAAKLDAFFDANVVAVDRNAPEGYDLVINATPLGLDEADALPVDVARMDAHAALFDILLRNQPTPLVRAARARGLNAQAGFEMLIQQMPHYFGYFGHKDAAEALRKDADFLRELIYPAAMAAEITAPLRYRSDNVA
ncbi:shikimate dehydrogenase [Variovorax beijingensis]|jgi:shikimate dehydrogenase|uniref:Shikimate dehydrogenase n=1 Tax=Variovorax beijingensis TaxID=2496117 RepID=A0A561C173_9BURK|nr:MULTISPECIES: shikimate dehydrogenase [Variovorax]MDP9965279.1 shikimate dehydrogenase [Variovorax paradoxus]MDR6454939.1 shikimate dehydrogenase [Variovorax paradoxus]TWD84933.1 shikimate dehydrogenase [Variovorax beijingensis]